MANTPTSNPRLLNQTEYPPLLVLGAPAKSLPSILNKQITLENSKQIHNLTLRKVLLKKLQKINDDKAISIVLSMKKAKQLKKEIELLNKRNISDFRGKNIFVLYNNQCDGYSRPSCIFL